MRNEKDKLLAGSELKKAVSDVMDSERMSSYDAQSKKIFTYASVLAVILKYTVSEFKDCSQEEILACISGISDSTEVSMDGTLKKETVHMENVESKPLDEKTLYFDILFDVVLPKSKEHVGYALKIDFEVQRTLNLPYRIENRGVYYLSGEIGSQLNYVFEDSVEYSKLKKVYTIWVCVNDIPKDYQNTVIRYRFLPELVYGPAKLHLPDADLMEMVMIRLGNGNADVSESEIIRFLYGVFEYSEHKEYFEEFVNMESTPDGKELRKELSKMGGAATLLCNDVREKSFAQGREEGREEGRDIKEISLIRKKIARNLPTDVMAEHVEVSEDYVIAVMQIISEHPDWDDMAVAAEMQRLK